MSGGRGGSGNGQTLSEIMMDAADNIGKHNLTEEEIEAANNKEKEKATADRDGDYNSKQNEMIIIQKD